MSPLCKEYLYLLWVLLVGAIGGILGLLNEDGEPRKHRTKWAFTAATFTAMFLCWATFAIVKFFIHDVEFALAIGGIIAFMGAEWVRRKINKAADKKIDAIASKDYDDEMSDYERNLK
jgi:phage holin family (lysis protein S)|nr:MAG TPA: holin [Caudoviricetes sp.]